MAFLPNLPILIAAVAGWFVGAIWYGVLFAKPWVAALGKTVDIHKQEQAAKGRAAFVPHVIAFAANFIMAWILNGIMHHVGPLSLRSGLISGTFVWFGFVVTTMATNNAFGGRKWMLTLIDAGHWLAALLVIGAVLGSMGG